MGRGQVRHCCLALIVLAACSAGPADSASASGASGPASSSTGVTSGNQSSSDTSAASSTDATDAGGNFVNSDHPEDGLGCDGSGCDIWGPNTCGEGAHCAAASCCGGDELPGDARCTSYWDSNICVLTTGEDQFGEACTNNWISEPGSDTCAPGLICWGDQGEERCLAYCSGSEADPECPENSRCVIAGAGVLPICLPSCDPIAQDCSANELCIPSGDTDGFVCALDANGGTSPAGSSCAYANECNAGLMCHAGDEVQAGGCLAAGCCTPMCDLADPLPCPDDAQSCQPFLDPSAAQYAEVGACLLTP